MDALGALDVGTRLQVIEASCVYPKTQTMRETGQPAIVELRYRDLDTFTAAVADAKLNPHIKRLGFSLSIPTVLDGLVALYEPALIGRVDAVLVHHGGFAIVRFKNDAVDPTADSCSLFLPITELRMQAAAATQVGKAACISSDYAVPIIIGIMAIFAWAVAP